MEDALASQRVLESAAEYESSIAQLLTQIRSLNEELQQARSEIDRLKAEVSRLRHGEAARAAVATSANGSPPATVGIAVASGVRRILALELARVGTGVGPGTVALCRSIRSACPDVELITGGGVREWEDVNRLADAGADAVLVASALHDGTIVVPQV